MINTLKAIIEDPAFPEGLVWRRYGFGTNEIVVREQDEAQSLYLVERGSLRVTGQVQMENSRRIQPGICDLGPGDLFGELCLFGSRIRSASVTAISEGELIEIDGRGLSLYLDTHPELGYLFLKQLFTILIERLDRANQRVENLFAWGLKERGIDRYL